MDRDPLEAEWMRVRIFGRLFRDGAVEQVRVGRFELRERIGAGGMGAVWAAHDPDLDREVAIKVLFEQGEHARLRREAQAMARLRHEHVVAVYEVGTWNEHTFVAMERVDGPTLRAWLGAQRRTVAEILRVLVEAGRGLSAAHVAGLVHCDFKPDNVLLDARDRARVSDFGLATGDGEDKRAAGGTPAYMAPEQHRGEPATARSDQYAFAVVVHEALLGWRPGEDPPVPAVDRGARGRVPARVHRAVARGLAQDPAARFPDMDAMLDALAPRVAHRRWAVAAALAVVALAAVAMTFALRSPPRAAVASDVCGGARAELAGAWDRERADALRTAFASAHAPYAAAAADRTIEILDRYAADWVTMHEQACRATRVHRAQPEAQLALRLGCLSERRRHLASLAARLGEGGEIVEHAVRAASQLPALERCADLAALTERVPPPDDPAIATRIDAVRETLAAGSAARLAGRYDEALTLARTAAAAADAIGYAPLTAAAQLLVGQSAYRAGERALGATALERAYREGLAGRDDVVAADAALGLAHGLGYLDARVDEGRRWARDGQALIRRLGGDPILEATLANVEGNLADASGTYEEARLAFARAHRAWLAAPGEHRIEAAGALQNEGNAASHLGRHAEALERLLAAETMWSEALGRDHPQLAALHSNVGKILRALGRADEALERDLRALAIDRANLPGDHPDVGMSLGAVGVGMLALGRYREALDHFEQAHAIFAAKLGERHPLIAATQTNEGLALLGLGELDRARRALEASLALKIEIRGPTHISSMSTLVALGRLELRRARPRPARVHFQRALELAEAALGKDSSELADALVGLGRSYLDAGAAAAARPPLERATALLAGDVAGAPALAEARLHLGRALLLTGDASDGRALVALAAPVLDAAGPVYADEARLARTLL